MPRGQVSIRFARKVDTWVGLAACALLYEYARLRREGLPRHRATTPPRADRPSFAPKRILTIKTYGLGNMAILLPVLAALRREYPGAEIDVLTLDSNCDFIERSGLIDRTIPLRLDSLRTVASSLWSIVRTTRSREYDLVID
ncbi:MAG TPA: hypothetical protein VKA21_05505, partial [Candidatus Binatia bacterium]|nr:hypothetical protein [Candidatus Binatia bacterium]